MTVTQKEIKTRIKVTIKGKVQGIGFRPFLFRLANKLKIKGVINNTTEGVEVDVEGYTNAFNTFIEEINSKKPEGSTITSLNIDDLPIIGYENLEIVKSEVSGYKTGLIQPDMATCKDCLKEIFEKGNRRYFYPFTNCTSCGPRYSIIESIPYDRENTTMKKFLMCNKCLEEYNDSNNRRFHAEPNACSDCGPTIELHNNLNINIANKDNALLLAAELLKKGEIVALKGIGGFQLLVNANNDSAVMKLRERKRRQSKPFALMVSSINKVKELCEVSALEEMLLTSKEAPIALLKINKNSNLCISPHVICKSQYIGVMLPYSPLHHLLMYLVDFPIVATSGNISEEPICISNEEAFTKLSKIADYFLIHDRPVKRALDDSIVKVINNESMVLRSARGYSPASFKADYNNEILAVGGHLKNTFAISKGGNFIVSQHIGDLKSFESINYFKDSILDILKLYPQRQKIVACDLHPAYYSTVYAKDNYDEIIQIQHHHAHIVSCMFENKIENDVLGICWDGTGYGVDETIWGGEFLIANKKTYNRIGSFKTFSLPGNEQAIKEPRRQAIGLLYEIYKNDLINLSYLECIKSFKKDELAIIIQMLNKGINTSQTSSVGRLFDAVSSLIDVCQFVTYEGEAAQDLESLICKKITESTYDFQLLEKKSKIVVDWQDMIKEIISDIKFNFSKNEISQKFHNTLVRIIHAIANKVGIKDVVLSGGCFQNSYLLEESISTLSENGFNVYWNKKIPTNDGGISVGQLVIASEIQKCV